MAIGRVASSELELDYSIAKLEEKKKIKKNIIGKQIAKLYWKIDSYRWYTEETKFMVLNLKF